LCDGFVVDRVECLSPVQEEEVEGVIMPLVEFEQPAEDMYGLGSGAVGSKAILGGAEASIEAGSETFLEKGGIDLVKGVA
jgi:hypothetical protein